MTVRRHRGLILLLLLIIFVWSLVSLQIKSYASVPDEITVHREVVLSDIVTNHEHGFTIYENAEGQIVYSADVTAEPTLSDTSLVLLDTFDPGLQYIMTNGYPYTEITGNDEIDKYIMQAVIWRYIDDDHVSQEFKNATVTDVYKVIDKYISPLLSSARAKAEEYSDVETMQADQFITLPCSDLRNLSMSEDATYFESSLMAPGINKAYVYNVKLIDAPDGAEVLDDRSLARETFSSGEKFKVRMPTSDANSAAQIKVSVSCEVMLPYVSLYGKKDDPLAERFVCLEETESEISKELILPIEKENDNYGLLSNCVAAIAPLAIIAISLVFFRRQRWFARSCGVSALFDGNVDGQRSELVNLRDRLL